MGGTYGSCICSSWRISPYGISCTRTVGRRGQRGEAMWPGLWRSVSRRPVAFVLSAAEPGTRLGSVAVPDIFGPLASHPSNVLWIMGAGNMGTSAIKSRNVTSAKTTVTCREIARLQLHHVIRPLRLVFTKTAGAHASRNPSEENNVPLFNVLRESEHRCEVR